MATTLNVFAQGSAFTYQGRLNASGTAANGEYEMTFTLYDAVTNGTVVDIGQTVAPVPVTNGLFTVALDFGAMAFDGNPRWLEITVNVFGSDMIPTTLTPRQRILPAPYAIHAANAAGLMSFNNAPLDIKVNGEHALRLEPTSLWDSQISGAPNVIGGSSANVVSFEAAGATIAGGGAVNYYGTDVRNSIESPFATIGGGMSNSISTQAEGAVIAGGMRNTIKSEGVHSSIGGGFLNIIQEDAGTATISGGRENDVKGDGGTISGGWGNTASGYGVVAGGQNNFIDRLANHSTIGGGTGNTNSSAYGTIGGGVGNRIDFDSPFSTIAGGDGNLVGTNAANAVIGGGLFNRILTDSLHSTISGGASNFMADKVERSTIGGGANNYIGYFANATTIAGGMNNVIDGVTGGSTISGGWFNHINEEASLVTIAGGGNNLISDNAGSAVISGGEFNVVGASYAVVGGGQGNSALYPGHYGTIAGGVSNVVADYNATVSGGGYNRASAYGATVAGGGGLYDDLEPAGNHAGAKWSTVSGGALNAALGTNSTVSGGSYNIARGNHSTVPGGFGNAAEGDYSMAAGVNAQANHIGAFVWSDASFGTPLISSTNHQFTVRASGGVRFFTDTNATVGAELPAGSGAWSMLSDRNAKENFAPANGREVLEKVAALPLATWNYKSQDHSIRHIGPMAQDFHAAFGVGENERTITSVDADGVALAAIQGLNQKVEEANRALRAALNAKNEEIAELKRGLAELRHWIERR